MTANVLQIALATGYPVVPVDGWESRGRGGLDPKGLLWHHTASARSGGNAPSLGICTNGRGGADRYLPGPLCNWLIGRDGTIYVVAAGVANHAGNCSAPDYLALISGSFDLDSSNQPLPRSDIVPNRFLFGVEVENDGRDEPYSDRCLDSLISLSAATMRALGLTAHSCGHHRELTTRKIDMSYRGSLRRAVAARMSAPGPGSHVTLSDQEVPMPALVKATNNPTWWMRCDDGVMIPYAEGSSFADADSTLPRCETSEEVLSKLRAMSDRVLAR